MPTSYLLYPADVVVMYVDIVDADQAVLDVQLGTRYELNYEAGILPACVLDEDWLERVKQSLIILEDEPWFTSLWTLQESLLRPEAFLLSRKGHQLSRQGYLNVGLVSLQTAWGDIELALQRTADFLAASKPRTREP